MRLLMSDEWFPDPGAERADRWYDEAIGEAISILREAADDPASIESLEQGHEHGCGRWRWRWRDPDTTDVEPVDLGALCHEMDDWFRAIAHDCC